MINTDTDELRNKRICYNCVIEKFLSKQIELYGKRRKCSYCSDVVKTILVGELASKIQNTFERFYERTSHIPDPFESAMLADKESSYEWERGGEPIIEAIQMVADIPEEAAIDIQEILEWEFYSRSAEEIGEETEFAKDSHYDYKGIDSSIWNEEWLSFEKSLKTETRYFNRFGETHLKRIFNDIEELKTAKANPIVIVAGPKQSLNHFYRARSFQSLQDLKFALTDIDTHLGPPPHKLARAGRMNAVGVSVFYGATNENVAIAEVRPPVGSKVAVSKFNIIRDLRLLNLQALNDIEVKGSLFDEQHIELVSRVQFLKKLCSKMIVPVMPDDENTEYLITQAIADYLSINRKLSLDGILFPSIQTKNQGANVVLFHKASKVKARELPPGTAVDVTLEAYGEDDTYPWYRIEEAIPPKSKRNHIKKAYVYDVSEIDSRNPSLAMDEEAINIHEIAEVTYLTAPNDVQIIRYEKSDFEAANDSFPHDWS